MKTGLFAKRPSMLRKLKKRIFALILLNFVFFAALNYELHSLKCVELIYPNKHKVINTKPFS